MALSSVLLAGCIVEGAGDRTPVSATRDDVPAPPSAGELGAGPYADFSNSLGSTETIPVRGRLIRISSNLEPVKTAPIDQVSQDELKGATVELVLLGAGVEWALGTVATDDEGYVDTSFDLSNLGVPEGQYSVFVYHRGELAGGFYARLLGEGGPLLVRSDVDMTYLDTDFQSVLGLVELMGASAEEREALPGMAEVYRALRAGNSGIENRPLGFVSGSPKFFKMILEEKMALDGVVEDGLRLKPMKDLVVDSVFDLDFDGIYPTLHDQIGYKLTQLLTARQAVPAAQKEILLGDDTEADAVVYALYARVLRGEIDADGLGSQVSALGVPDVWREQLEGLVARLQSRGTGEFVEAIYINETGTPGQEFPVAEWTVPGVTRSHRGALPLIVDLRERGLVNGEAVARVEAAL